MSTRSGKRIYSSNTDNVEIVSELVIDRKTRSKKAKEHSDEETTVQKKNFVSRPSNDEVKSSKNKTEYTSKSVRKSKRYTLREINIPVVDNEVSVNRKSMRHSRRTRKEDADVSTDVHSQENNEMGIGKKKNKKTKKATIENSENEPVKAIITKKKTGKKKRKSNSFIVEELVIEKHSKSFNKSNVSIDSFHSAAGSPAKDNLKNIDKKDDKITNNRDRKESNSLSPHKSDEGINQTKNKSKKIEEKDHFETSMNNFDKISGSNDSSINKDEDIKDKDENRIKKEICGTSKTKRKIKKSKETNFLCDFGNIITSMELHSSIESNIHSKDFEKKSIGTNYINSPTSNINLNNTSYVNGTLNGLESTLNKDSKKKKKSSTKNSTFDTEDTCILNEYTKESSINLKIESDVQSDEITVIHPTSSQKSSLINSKDATCDKINLSGINFVQSLENEINSFNKDFNVDKEFSFNNRKSSRKTFIIPNAILDIVEDNLVDNAMNKKTNNSNDKKSRKSSRISLSQDMVCTILNGTYDKSSRDDSSSFCNNTYNKSKLDTTFERVRESIDEENTINVHPKSSTISSDNTDNMTSDISQDCSRISISDDSSTGNIGNCSPLLIESSIEESQINSPSTLFNKFATPQKEETVITSDSQESLSDNNKSTVREGIITEMKMTPLQRSGTYTELRKTPSKHRASPIEESGSQDSENPKTPLRREGTFTKDSPDVMSPKQKIEVDKTPTRRRSTNSPGRTPFPSSRSGSKGRATLNVTHSIEKPRKRSSAAAGAPRLTKVMFRSPVDDPVAVTQMKGKVIKSSLKGSNRSFMFEETAPSPGGARKRSRTHGGAEEGAKRARLAVPRATDTPRARTASAAARLQNSVEPQATPPPSKSNAKLRTKLPNFAALHQKQFSKMESLDECQRRRARRARALLTPTAPTAHRAPAPTEPIAPTAHRELAPIAPTATTAHRAPAATAPTVPSAPTAHRAPAPTAPGGAHRNSNKELKEIEQQQHTKRPEMLKTKQNDKKNQSYTRFGFKLNLDVNPFSVPTKAGASNVKDVTKPQALPRQATLPSLAGAVALTQRKELAKQTVMREKSFTDKRQVNRHQNRTLIKGVRTNRRFELQMKMRNID